MKRKIIDISVDNLEGVSSSMKGLRTEPRTKKHYKGKVETISVLDQDKICRYRTGTR